MATLWQRIQMATKAFREGYITSDLLDSGDYDDFDSRKLRYQVLWAMYENTLFRDIHKWAQAYRNTYGLYKEIRNIYSPANRMVEFWKMIIWGGFLHDEALEEGAIPIKTDNESIRTAIKQLWMDSNWAVQKDILVGWGTSLGDTAIRIVDDVTNKEVRIEPVHPGTIKDVDVDPKGYVISYELEEVRILDEENVKSKEVVYREVATIDDKGVVTYETFVDDKPASWDGQPETWTESYGFIPLIPIQHNNVGSPWGWAEIHPGRSKINEIEDLASKMHDYIRKVVDPIWLMNFKKPKDSADMEHTTAATSTDRPAPAREEIPAIYVPNPQAKAEPLVTDMIDIEKTSIAIQHILAELERDFPELQMDIWTVGGYTTGAAMKTARQKVERKVQQRRPNYDGALIKAHKMAMAIGSQRNYEGYGDFSSDLDDDAKDHYIPADRIIFEADALEELDKKKKFWDVMIDVVAKSKGQIPPKMVLRDFGWSEARIDEFLVEFEIYRTKYLAEMAEGVGNDEEDEVGNGSERGRDSEDGLEGETGDDSGRGQGERGSGR